MGGMWDLRPHWASLQQAIKGLFYIRATWMYLSECNSNSKLFNYLEEQIKISPLLCEQPKSLPAQALPQLSPTVPPLPAQCVWSGLPQGPGPPCHHPSFPGHQWYLLSTCSRESTDTAALERAQPGLLLLLPGSEWATHHEPTSISSALCATPAPPKYSPHLVQWEYCQFRTAEEWPCHDWTVFEALPRPLLLTHEPGADNLYLVMNWNGTWTAQGQRELILLSLKHFTGWHPAVQALPSPFPTAATTTLNYSPATQHSTHLWFSLQSCLRTESRIETWAQPALQLP